MSGERVMRVLVVIGTRPEAIKMAPVVSALQANPAFEPVVVATAQHRDLLDQVLDLFGIVPTFDLDIMEHGQSLEQINSRVLLGMGEILAAGEYAAVVVHGDTTTTLAAALAAFYHRVPVAHVEAGMRTGDLRHPFPEEANRSIVARITAWNFPPSDACEHNLLAEGIDPSRIFRTPHNTVIDALRMVKDMPYDFPPGAVADALASGRRIVLVTTHRRESWGEPMEGIFSAIAQMAERFDDVHVLVATHSNPRVVEAARRILGGRDRIDLIGPQGYLPFVKLMQVATLIASDSGGVQEEGPALGTPVLVLRNVTEYPELVARGVVKLAGTQESGVLDALDTLLGDPAAYAAMKAACSDFGAADGVEAIVEALLSER